MMKPITPSLERIAILKIVSWLWNQNDIRASIEIYFILKYFTNVKESDSEQKWRKIEDKVLEKVSNLQQPEPIKEKIGGVVRPIGREILKWMQNSCNGFLCFLDNFVVGLPSDFFFTQLGRIDAQKSAELLIKDETCIEVKYRLACLYCLEDYLPDLWNKLPEDSKLDYYKPNGLTTEILETDTFMPMEFFAYSLQGEFVKTTSSYRQSFYVHQFKQALFDGNIMVAEYFYKKMTNDSKSSIPEAIEVAIDERGLTSNLVENVCFLLSKMNEEDQIRVLRSPPVLKEVLLCMLDWPWQCFFIETITLMHSFISQSVYEELLNKIIYKVIDGYKDCCYRDIFIKLCLRIPKEERHHILHKVCASGSLLENLFKIKDEQSMKLIFQDATPELKKEFIVSDKGTVICSKLIEASEWNLLENFIQDCITTKDELVNFKGNIFKLERQDLCNSGIWSKFSCFLDSLIYKPDK